MSLLSQRADEVTEILGRYPEKRAALMPLLNAAQEVYGYVSEEAIREVATITELDPTEVFSVAEFYSLYYKRPVGKYVIRFCTDMPCALVGAEWAYQQMLEIVGVESGETSADGMFTVEPCVCLAACGSAPVAIVNRQFHENLTPERMRSLIETIRASGLPEDAPALNFEPRTNPGTPTGF